LGSRTQRETIACALVVGTESIVVRLRRVQPQRLLGPLHQESRPQIHLVRDWEAPGNSLAAFFLEEALSGVNAQTEKAREKDSGETLI